MKELNVNTLCSFVFLAVRGHHEFKEICLGFFVVRPNLTLTIINDSNGNCAISNNIAENAIRPFTVGRKNWLFSDTPKGAKASADVYSIVETAKANGLDVFKYFELLLTVLPTMAFLTNPDILEELLPWNESVKKICKAI